MTFKYLQARWWLWLGPARLKREDYRGALECYETVLRFFPRNLQALANAGHCLHQLGLNVKAIDFYDRALQECPDYADVHARLGVTFWHLARYQESTDSLNRAFRMQPALRKAPWFATTLASSLGSLGRMEDALEACRDAVEYTPQDARAQHGLGWALSELGEYAEAEVPLRTAIKLEPAYPKPYLCLSFVLDELRKYDESFVFAEKYAALEPEDPVAHSTVGWHLSATGKQREALLAYKRALELNPELAQAWYELGRIHALLGEYQEAIDAEEKALSLDQNPLAFCVMGLALLQKGDHQRSIFYSQKAVETRPQLHEAWNNLGEAHLALGHLEKAVRCFEKVIELAPAIPEVAELRLQIGSAQLKLGNKEAAQNQYLLLQAMGSDKAKELSNAILAEDSLEMP